MTEREAIEMMARCSAEIKGLRADIERLRPKAEAYDNLAIVLNGLVPQPSHGMGEDLAWTLDKRIREVSEKYKSPKMEQAA